MTPLRPACRAWGPLVEDAPAKVNLTLHVTGRRSDGYHLLDSIVVFCHVGDSLRLRAARRPRLRVSGPFANDVPTGPENLVLRAAELAGVGCEIELEKRLPVAAGIGGGSSDAGAVLRAIARLTGQRVEGAERLGADVPVCIAAQPRRMMGVGDRLSPLPPLPPLSLVLVNPMVPLGTREVFAALPDRQKPPMPDEIPRWSDAAEAADWLSRQRNDLEAAAVALVPEVAESIGAVARSAGCLLARMSGSGATVFGIFATPEQAAAAAERIATSRPSWWVRATELADQEIRLTT